MIPYALMTQSSRAGVRVLLWLLPAIASAQIPKLTTTPTIDGNLSEWKRLAHNDGLWDIERLRRSPWYEPERNRITLHPGETAAPEQDLAARYYTAWDDTSIYLGAEVTDNVNDVADRAHEPKRWYYKDAICWFIEAPRLARGQNFGERDNAFCFVADPAKPPYAAWWRHGAPGGKTYLEEPIPAGAVAWAVKPNPQGFTFEARVAMAPTFGVSSPAWRAPRIGDTYGLTIVHTDPDGGEYGGHFLIYGRGDNDASWTAFTLTGPIAPVERQPK